MCVLGGGPRSSIGDFCEYEGRVSQIIGRRFRWLGRGVSDHRLTISAGRGGRGVPDHRSVSSASMKGECLISDYRSVVVVVWEGDCPRSSVDDTCVYGGQGGSQIIDQ